MPSIMFRQNSQVLEPLEHLLCVLVGPLARHGSLHNGKAISLKVVAEIAKGSFLLCATEEKLASNVLVARGDGLRCACHLVSYIDAI
jgi:hypothetical protein